MWLTLAVMLITYLLSPKGTDKEKRQALTNAALAGGAAYVATEYTDWGKDLSNQFNGALGIGGTSTTAAEAASGTKVPSGTTTTGSGSGLGSLGNWITGGLAAGAGAGIVSKMPSWVLYAALGLGAYLLLKD